MDIDVLCDVEMFEIEARFIEVESMPQHSETQKEIVDVDEKVVWKVQLQQLEANKKLGLHITTLLMCGCFLL